MIKEIKYNGYTENPSGYVCPDGELMASWGALHEDGSLKTISPPTIKALMPSGYSIVFTHASTQMKHYIVYRINGSDHEFYWMEASVIDDAVHGAPVPEATILSSLHYFTGRLEQMLYVFNGIDSVGNTLMIMDGDGINYYLWKEAGEGQQYGSYTSLGTHIPELTLSFGLQSEMVRSEMYEVSAIEGGFVPREDFIDHLYNDEVKETVTNDILGKVNKFIKEKADEAGKFIFPFLVRYAYRLYDGSLTMHSAPVLMVCSSDLAPLAVTKLDVDGGYYLISLKYYVMAARHTLDFAAVSASEITALQRWSDIVRSVDIFVSAPIYTYDQSGEIENLYSYDASDTFCISTFDGTTYQHNSIMDEYRSTYDDAADYDYVLNLPHYSSDKVRSSIRDCHDFYLLDSVKTDNLSTVRQTVSIEEGYLDSLRARESMTDDYDSHDTLIPRYAFSYNQRMNIANLEKTLFDGFTVNGMTAYTNASGDTTWQAYVHIRQDGKEIVVKGADEQADSGRPVLMLYYPNVNAYKITLHRMGEYKEYPLEAHDFLNGAFYFRGWSEASTRVYDPGEEPTVTDNATVNVPNKIYTSEVNNPFYFPLLGINTVGTGEIYGIAAAVKALSEGQFGQFPLYAFTSEGVWALEVGSTGTYSTVQPVTRDVCVNPASITSIDTAVLFATDRGIMLLSGSKSVCITDVIDTEVPIPVLMLPSYGGLLEETGLTEDNVILRPFREFVRTCSMLYDYVGQRIIVYAPVDGTYREDISYAYVYSLESGKWGMMVSDIIYGFNSYPSCLANTQSGIADFSHPDLYTMDMIDGVLTEYLTEIKGLVVTRPLKLDYPDALKTVRTVVQRGMFDEGHVKCALYGSRDMLRWHLVGSSVTHRLRGISGTPYKYFILAMPLSLTYMESLTGCTIEYEVKEANRLR